MIFARTSQLSRAAVALVALGVFAQLGCAAAPARPASAAEMVAPDDGLNQLTDEQLARKMLEVTGSGNLGKQVVDAMLDNFKNTPRLPPGFIETFRKNVQPDSLLELVIPIYLKHYDRETMKASIRFYQSPAGQQIVRVSPVLTQESMEAGKAWGIALAKKTYQELHAQ